MNDRSQGIHWNKDDIMEPVMAMMQMIVQPLGPHAMSIAHVWRVVSVPALQGFMR